MFDKQLKNRETIQFSLIPFSVSNRQDSQIEYGVQYQQSIESENKGNLINQYLLKKYQDESLINQTQIKLQYQKQKHIKLWYRMVKKFRSIRPESNYLFLWNLFIVISILFNFYEIPVSIFFTDAVYQAEFTSPIGLVLNIFFCVAIFINTIIVRPITAYYNLGSIVTSRKAILQKYFKLQFWLNGVAWFVLFLYIVSRNRSFVYPKLLFYLYFFKLQQISKLTSAKLQLHRVRYGIYKFFRLVSLLILLVIWLAGAFFAIDYKFYIQKNEYYPVNLWLTNSVCCQYKDLNYIYLPQQYQWYVWLNYAVYWALQTVSTVGYGDLTPRNPIQVAFCDIIILLLCVGYAFFVSQVWQIFSEIFQGDGYYRSKIIKNYERKYKINRQLAVKLQYHIYNTKKAKQKEQKQLQIIENLSDDLRSQLILTRQKRLFANIPFFNQLSHYCLQYSEFLYNLAIISKQERYGQNQLVYRCNYIRVNFSFLSLGQLDLHYQNSKVTTVLKIKDKNKPFFGMYEFLTKTPSRYEVRALKFAKISQIDQDSFMKNVRKFPNIHEKHQQLFQRIKLQGQHQLCGQICWVCQNKYHGICDCPQYFSWLSSLRSIDIPCVIRTKITRKITFRQYFNRKTFKSSKIYCLKSNYNKSKLKDSLILNNSNFVDQVKNFSIYRMFYNL